MTNAMRLQDLADVQRLIHELKVPRDFSRQLNPFVHDKFHELWQTVADNSVNQELRH